MASIGQPRLAPRTVAQSSTIEWTVFVDEDDYTWTGVYRNLSYTTVARIYDRCYNREFDDWDHDSWNYGQIVAQCDIRPYYLRDLLESRLGSSCESPLQELISSLDNLRRFIIRRLTSVYLDNVSSCLDCCGAIGLLCTRARTCGSGLRTWSQWATARQQGLCVPGRIGEIPTGNTQPRLRERTIGSSRNAEVLTATDESGIS